jgi:hypothetical protein
MYSKHVMFSMRRMLIATGIVGLLGAVVASASVAALETNDVAVQAKKEALDTWHESIKHLAPPTTGCFHATYPSVIWQKEACLPMSAHRAVMPPHFVKQAVNGQAKIGGVAVDTVGNGNDYSVKTDTLTSSAIGSFPSVSGVTSTSNYTLQLNTNISASAGCNVTYGYSSCVTWQQFVYGTTGEGDGTPPQAFIQDWIFLSEADYISIGCPDGWISYAAQDACYTDSAAVKAPNVVLSNLGNVTLSGSASTNGNDTVIFTNGTTARSVSQSGRTLSIGSTWNQSEFNVFGDGGGSDLSFNEGASLTVKIEVTDGETSAPECAGPSNGGTTAETNNLTLGSCIAKAASSSASPHIKFTESN